VSQLFLLLTRITKNTPIPPFNTQLTWSVPTAFVEVITTAFGDTLRDPRLLLLGTAPRLKINGTSKAVMEPTLATLAPMVWTRSMPS